MLALVDYSAIGGGQGNTASAGLSTIGGGYHNTASASGATIGGGDSNIASNHYTTVPGGASNSATGLYSFAAGTHAKANHQSAMVFSASIREQLSDSVQSGGIAQIILRADGCIYVTNTKGSAPYVTDRLINTNSGAYLTTTGTWTNASDRNLKENFTVVDGEDILRKIMVLPISQWNYKGDSDQVKHIGPVAQDFYDLFGLGDSDKAISTIDPIGVALVAIQELYKTTQKLKKKTLEIEAQQREIEALQTAMAELQARVKAAAQE